MEIHRHDIDNAGLGERIDHELVTDLVLSTRTTALWRYDFTTDHLDTSQDMAALLGLNDAPDELTPMLTALIDPILRSARTTERQHFHREHPLPTSQGVRWIQLRARRLRDGDDGLLGLATDVTTNHDTRQALTDVADRYRLLSELSPDSIVVHQDGHLVYANQATARLLAAPTPQSLLHRPITEFVDLESIPGLRDRIAGLTEHGATSPPSEVLLRRVDGTTVLIESVSVRTAWQGRPAYQVIMRDLTAQKLTDQALRYQAALVCHVSDAIIGTDRAGVVTSWNEAAHTIYGHSTAAALDRPVADLVGAPLDPAAIVRAGGVADGTHHRADGAALEIRVSAAEMAEGYVLMCCDETRRRHAERLFTTVVATLDEGVAVIGATGRVEAANPAANRILGLRAGTDRSPAGEFGDWEVYDDRDNPLPSEEQPADVVARTGRPDNGRILQLRHPDGRVRWLSHSCRPLTPGQPGPASVVVSFTDITEQRQTSQRLRYQATHDPLTGLPNRTLLHQRLADIVRGQRRTGTAALLSLDLDTFTVINDSLGQTAGDEVLRIVGARLTNTVRRTSLVARLGGDEFAVLVIGLRDANAGRRVAERILAALNAPIALRGHRLHLHASIGIALIAPDEQRDAEEILRDADVALYHAKTLGKGRYEFFDVTLRQRLQRRLLLEQDLRAALTTGQLRMVYQPVADIRGDGADGIDVVSVEALLRWTHPRHGDIAPAEFIPLAEDSDLITKIGAYTLATTTREITAWRTAHDRDLGLAVNLSARQLDDVDLVPTVRRALTETGLPASRLCLEITESVLMGDLTAAHEQLARLRELGIRLAIDDFGTGYSSLAQVRRLPVDTLKIDQSFIRGLADSRDDRAIVGSIIAMAHTVGLRVIAEGVETAEQLDVLRSLDCDQVQGHHVGRPVAVDELPG